MSAVYNYRGSPSAGIVTKFDDDLNVESSYTIEITDGELRCGCPAGARPSCRHRQMFTQLRERMNTAWFLDFDTRSWVDPTGEAKRFDELEQVIAIPERTVLEESSPQPEPITKLDDSHPFRRRM